MFRCQITNRMSEPGQKCHLVVVETRFKEYEEAVYNEITRKYENKIVGSGFETVRSVKASDLGLEKWNKMSKEEKDHFVKLLKSGKI